MIPVPVAVAGNIKSAVAVERNCFNYTLTLNNREMAFRKDNTGICRRPDGRLEAVVFHRYSQL